MLEAFCWILHKGQQNDLLIINKWQKKYLHKKTSIFVMGHKKTHRLHYCNVTLPLFIPCRCQKPFRLHRSPCLLFFVSVCFVKEQKVALGNDVTLQLSYVLYNGVTTGLRPLGTAFLNRVSCEKRYYSWYLVWKCTWVLFFKKTRSVSGSCNGTHHRFHGEKKAWFK